MVPSAKVPYVRAYGTELVRMRCALCIPVSSSDVYRDREGRMYAYAPNGWKLRSFVCGTPCREIETEAKLDLLFSSSVSRSIESWHVHSEKAGVPNETYARAVHAVFRVCSQELHSSS